MKCIMYYRKKGSHEVWQTYFGSSKKDCVDFLKSKKCYFEFELYELTEKGYVIGDTAINLKMYEEIVKMDIKAHLDDDDVEVWDDEFEDEDMEMTPEELEEDEFCFKTSVIDNLKVNKLAKEMLNKMNNIITPEEFEDEKHETKLEYLYRKYDCNDMETLKTKCPIDIEKYKQFVCLNSDATDDFKKAIDKCEEKENEAIMKIIEERDKNDNGNRYTLEDIISAFLNTKGIH